MRLYFLGKSRLPSNQLTSDGRRSELAAEHSGLLSAVASYSPNICCCQRFEENLRHRNIAVYFGESSNVDEHSRHGDGLLRRSLL